VDRGRRFRLVQTPPIESDDMRRKIARVVVFAEAAEELARAAQVALIAADAEPIDVEGMGLGALRAALARYREARDG
jgi:hypothetical protein